MPETVLPAAGALNQTSSAPLSGAAVEPVLVTVGVGVIVGVGVTVGVGVADAVVPLLLMVMLRSASVELPEAS